jgi:hypothetical protein
LSFSFSFPKPVVQLSEEIIDNCLTFEELQGEKGLFVSLFMLKEINYALNLVFYSQVGSIGYSRIQFLQVGKMIAFPANVGYFKKCS